MKTHVVNLMHFQDEIAHLFFYKRKRLEAKVLGKDFFQFLNNRLPQCASTLLVR